MSKLQEENERLSELLLEAYHAITCCTIVVFEDNAKAFLNGALFTCDKVQENLQPITHKLEKEITFVDGDGNIVEKRERK